MPVRNCFASEAWRQRIFHSSSFSRFVVFRPLPSVLSRASQSSNNKFLPRVIIYSTLLLVINLRPALSDPDTIVTVVESESEVPNSADCPHSCDLAGCPPETLKNEDACPSGTRVLDTCGCCPVCLRMVNEVCGGARDRYGLCSNGLKCFYQRGAKSDSIEDATSNLRVVEKEQTGVCSEILIKKTDQKDCERPVVSKGCNFVSPIKGCLCREISACQPVSFQYSTEQECEKDFSKLKGMWSEECLRAKCAVVFQPNCPDDSFLVVTPPEPPDCCQKHGTCTCNQKKCLESVVDCDAGLELTRVKKGTIQPGNCCDTYECTKRVLDCEGVICPEVEILDCPQDSYRPPTAIVHGTCCSLVESCKCLPGICAPAHCPPRKKLKVISKGDGFPGSCCDEFECVANATNPDANLQIATAKTDAEVQILEDSLATNSEQVSEDVNQKLDKENEIDGFDSKQRRTVDLSLNQLAQKPCLHESGLYHDGQKWYPNLCSECECQGGVTFCRKMTCPRVPESCTWVETAETECCPLCLGCLTEDGSKVNLTESWDKDDCTSCTCGEAGSVLCQTQLCRVTCDHPVKVKGRCCPLCEKPTLVTIPPGCPSIQHCPLRCEYGLKKDDRGCFVCACDHISDEDISIFGLNCKPLSQENCIKKCAHGYVHDENGCGICVCAKCPPLHQCYKHCLYGFQKNAYGCPVCKCKSRVYPGDINAKDLSTASNTSLPTSNKKMSSSLERPFPTEDTVKFPDPIACEGPQGQKHDPGEWWHDGCRHCYCEQGREYCSLIACPNLECSTESVIRVPTDCCPRCKNDTLTPEKHVHTVCHAPGSGRLFVDGETWDMTPCIRCTCRVGHVLCYAAPCPPITCANPIRRGCCHVCAEGEMDSLLGEKDESISEAKIEEFDDKLTICTADNGVAHVQSSSWRVDECTSCRCEEGGIECFPEVCESPVKEEETGELCKSRPLRIKGKCCPMCTDSLAKGLCQYGNTYYAIGEEWKEGSCTNCSCTDGGQTMCTKLQCPPCHLPKEIPGRCCPLCEENVPSWSLRPTLYPPDSGNYNEAQQINLILLFSVLGLALVIVLVIVAICLCYKSRCSSAAEEKKKQARMEQQSNGRDPLIPGSLLGPQTQSTPGLSVTTVGPYLTTPGQGSFSAKLLRVKEPRSEQSVSLLSATSNGSSGSSSNGVSNPGSGGGPSPNGCARAASFNVKKITEPCGGNVGQRPRSCKV